MKSTNTLAQHVKAYLPNLGLGAGLGRGTGLGRGAGLGRGGGLKVPNT